MIKIICAILLLQIGTNFVSSQKIVGCYFGAWATVDQIDVTLCTHVYYAFYAPNTSGGVQDSYGKGSSFLALKSKSPSTKFFASIGGADSASNAAFSAIAASTSITKTFVDSCLALISLGFDGIDVDWEFPGSTEQTSFVDLLGTLKTALNEKGKILAAAVSSGSWRMDQSYIISSVCENLDLVNLMTYDMQWPYTTTGTNAGYSQVDAAAAAWIKGGCSARKIVLGLPTFGYDFQLITLSKNRVGAPALGANAISYRDICTTIKLGPWTTSRTDQTPVSYMGFTLISYDDVTSVTAKLSIVSARSLAGAFFWSTEQDDYDDSCGFGKFPLITAVSKALSGTFVPATTTTKAATTISTTTVAPFIPQRLFCKKDGIFAYPGNCNYFYRCLYGSARLFKCQDGFGFNPQEQYCDQKSIIQAFDEDCI